MKSLSLKFKIEEFSDFGEKIPEYCTSHFRPDYDTKIRSGLSFTVFSRKKKKTDFWLEK